MSRILLLALLLASACKHSSSASSSSHSETSTTTDSTSSETGATTTTTTVTEQPGETTTTTEEFLPPEKETAAPEEAADAGAQRQPLTEGRPTTPRHGPLVKRTVTVTKSGGEKTETVQQATSQGTAATETKAAAKVDAKAQEAEKGSPALSCAFGGWLAIAGVVAALFGLGYFAIKRLRNPV